MAWDQVHFGDNHRSAAEAFDYSFVCVDKETGMFQEQRADGILGLGRKSGQGVSSQVPIYDAMYNAGLVKEKQFNICLGQNGGYVQIGGYDRQVPLEDVKWFQLK